MNILRTMQNSDGTRFYVYEEAESVNGALAVVGRTAVHLGSGYAVGVWSVPEISRAVVAQLGTDPGWAQFDGFDGGRLPGGAKAMGARVKTAAKRATSVLLRGSGFGATRAYHWTCPRGHVSAAIDVQLSGQRCPRCGAPGDSMRPAGPERTCAGNRKRVSAEPGAPTWEELEAEMLEDGALETACEHAQRVEPDGACGTCGAPTWARKIGII